MTELGRRLIGMMITHNEEHRYLDATVRALCELTDEQVFVDDRSGDSTLGRTGDIVTGLFSPDWEKDSYLMTAPIDRSWSMTGEEWRVRQWAWDQMLDHCAPNESDWVLVLDADEFLVPTPFSSIANTRHLLEVAIHAAETEKKVALNFRVNEVFSTEGGPQVRVDGYWGAISATRCCRAGIVPDFARQGQGGGSLPVHALKNALPTGLVEILHFGYATEQDRLAKYHRYINTQGHGRKHVKSIISRPELRPWHGGNPLEETP